MFLGMGTKLDSFVAPAWHRAWLRSEEPVDGGSQQGRYCPLGAVSEIGKDVLIYHSVNRGKTAFCFVWNQEIFAVSEIITSPF